MADSKKTMQLELLMEKLRQKTSHLNLTESAKTFRMTILEKRYGNDVSEKAQYQKCLDLLQTNMKVTTLQSMLERLESISRQSGLKFTADASGRAFFISSDMFYLEVIVEPSGTVREVHIQHEGKNEPQTCSEIAMCLNSGNFSKFTSHLQGLCAIYQVSADKKLKAKAFAALSAVESDLSSMSKLQNYSHDVASLIHKSPLGLVIPRIGGQPLSLTYFISPFDLLNVQSQSLATTIEKIAEKGAGLSCTVGIACATNFQLPISPLLSVTRNSDGDSVPAFSPLNLSNSFTLPATFVLRMQQPLILCQLFAQQMQSITGVEVGSWERSEYLVRSLIKAANSNNQVEGHGEDCHRVTKPLRVTLPDQHHSYYVTESEDAAMKCCAISSISFSHPSHAPQVLSLLRRQALLNALLSSCIRPRSQSDSSSTLTFEINSITLNHLSIAFEHPQLEQMCSAEIALGADPSCIKCNLYGAEEDGGIASDEYATRVLQRCLSIPVTMRAILRQMQASSSRWVNGNSDHHGTFERRFQSQVNGDLDSHPPSNGSHGSHSFGGGTANGNGFDGGSHSPRTHSSDIHQHGSLLHSSTPKETDAFSSEMEQVGEVSIVEDTTDSANQTGKAAATSPDSWTPSLLTNPEVSMYNVHSQSIDSGLSVSGSTAPARRTSDASVKSDMSEIMEIGPGDSTTGATPAVSGESSSRSPPESMTTGSMPRGKDAASSKMSVLPAVSITPVTSFQSGNYPNITLERRPGIEIIPFGKDSSSSSIPSSLTITAVGSSGGSSSAKSSSSKDKNKYKDIRSRESSSADLDDKERERRERKRRREEEKSSSPSSGKSSKMICMSNTLMGPPALLKPDSSPKLNQKNSSIAGGSTPPSAGHSPLTSPAKSSSKSSTPSSSPKHPSTGGKPSMSALSMSAFKSVASSLTGSTSPSSKSKKSKDRDRDRSDKDRDREKDRDRDRDRERSKDRDRSKDREKKSRTPTPTSNHHSLGSRGPPLVKTKSLDFTLAVEDKLEPVKEESVSSQESILSDEVAVNPEVSVSQELPSLSPQPFAPDSENCKMNSSSSSADGATNCSSSGCASKSPLRSRKSSLSAVIDKLRLQHNPEADIFQNGPKHPGDPSAKPEQGEPSKNSSDFKSGFGLRLDSQPSSYIQDFSGENDLSSSPKANQDGEDSMHFHRIPSESNSPADPFTQDDSGINEAVDGLEGDLSGGDPVSKEFVRPFPPPTSRTSYRYRSSEADVNPASPSVSVHIVNVPSPLALPPPTRSPISNQLALVAATSAGASPASCTSQTSPCMSIDDDLMDEALVGLGK